MKTLTQSDLSMLPEQWRKIIRWYVLCCVFYVVLPPKQRKFNSNKSSSFLASHTQDLYAIEIKYVMVHHYVISGP